MSEELTGPLRADQLPDLAAALEYWNAAQNERTRTAYAGDWDKFLLWCQKQPGAGVSWKVCPAPVGVVAAYVAQLAQDGAAVASIRRYLVSIAVQHHDAGHPSPTSHPAIARVLRGIARTHGRAQRQADALMPEHIRHACIELSKRKGLHALRDRAVLLVGWCAALRHTELTELLVGDVSVDDRGAVLRVRRSKTDQLGHGEDIRLPHKPGDGITCPTETLRTWLSSSGASDRTLMRPVFLELRGDVLARDNAGGVFRMAPASVPRLCKRVARMNGLDPARFSGHSLRAGLITAASLAGAQDTAIMQVTRHRSADTLRKYQRKLHLRGRALADGLL